MTANLSLLPLATQPCKTGGDHICGEERTASNKPVGYSGSYCSLARAFSVPARRHLVTLSMKHQSALPNNTW
jgi:hypothetical protein